MNDTPKTPLERAHDMGYRLLADGPTDFPLIELDYVYDRNGTKVPGWIRLVNTVDGQTLAIHTASYELRPFSEGFSLLEAAITESGLDTRELMVRTEFSHNGGRCFRSYLFPNIMIGDDDPIALQILAFDSYDGSYSTSIAAGGFRGICLNGCFFGKTIQQLKVKHTKGSLVRFENGVQQVIKAAETFTAMAPRIKSWRETPVDVYTFKDMLSGLPQITDRLRDRLVANYATEAESGTLYGAWNILTKWASHSEGNAQTRVDRDRRVAALIDSPQWRVVESPRRA